MGNRFALIILLVLTYTPLNSSGEVVNGSKIYDRAMEYDIATRVKDCSGSVKRNSEIDAKFKKTWKKCGRGCKEPVLNVMPSPQHCLQSTPSCHHTGNAVDVGAIKCPWREKIITVDDPGGFALFDKIALCYEAQGWKLFWQDYRHKKHFHVEPKDCTKKKGCCNTTACLD